MRIELACLAAIVGLAILAGRITPEDTQASEAKIAGPSAAPAPSSDRDEQAASEAIRDVDRICALTEAQRRDLAERLAGICRNLAHTEKQLWRHVRGLAGPRAGAETDIRQLQRRCEQLAWRKELHIRQVLTADQRTCWLAEKIRPRLEAELRGLVLSPAQQAQVRRQVRRVLAQAGPEARMDTDLLLEIVRRVYLEVLTGRQRLAYADLVRQRDQAMRVARAKRED